MSVRVKEVMSIAERMPYVRETYDETHANRQGFLYATEGTPRGQPTVFLFTLENASSHVDVTGIPVNDGLLDPEEERHVADVLMWQTTAGKAAITILTRDYGPLATAAAFSDLKIELSSGERTFTVQQFIDLDDKARAIGILVKDLYLELIREKLQQELASAEEKGPLETKEAMGELADATRLMRVESEDIHSKHLWVLKTDESNFLGFSTDELARSLMGKAFAFRDNAEALDFARSVRATLSGRAQLLAAHQHDHVVTTQDIWDCIILQARKQKRVPIAPDFFKRNEALVPFRADLLRCNRIEDFPVDRLLAMQAALASKE